MNLLPGPESTRDIDEKSRRIYPVFVINDMQKTFDARATIIKKWHENGGVLILGYASYLFPVLYFTFCFALFHILLYVLFISCFALLHCRTSLAKILKIELGLRLLYIV